jgi:hypothetical protein
MEFIIKFLEKIPAGYRKFVIVAYGLSIFLFLCLVSFFFVDDAPGLSLVIAAIAGGIVSIAGIFFKFNKDVHANGKENLIEEKA